MSINSAAHTSEQFFTAVAAAIGAGDVMDVAKPFVGFGPAAGGLVLVLSTELQVDHTAVISGETSYLLKLYASQPSSGHDDNDAWDLPAGDRDVYLGQLELGTPVDVGSTLRIEVHKVNKPIQVPVGGTVWGELVTVGGFTATAAKRRVRIHTIDL